MPNDAPIGPGRPKDLAKREAILEAAKTLFLSLGYANTSMDAVAAAAGVSKLTVYSHFNDKQTLFCSAVMATCQIQLPDLLFEYPVGAQVEDVLLNIARGFQALISSDEAVKLSRLIMAQGSLDPSFGQYFYEAGPKRVLAGMEALLRGRMSAGCCASTTRCVRRSTSSAWSRGHRITACCWGARGRCRATRPRRMCARWWGCSCERTDPESIFWHTRSVGARMPVPVPPNRRTT